MIKTHPRGGSATAPLRRASLYLALGVIIALAVAAAAKVMQGQSPSSKASELRPAIAIAEPTGENKDSVKTILRRDLDFSDRLRVVAIQNLTGGPIPAADAGRSKVNASYVVTAGFEGGKLSVTLFDVRTRKVARTKEFPITGAPGDVRFASASSGGSVDPNYRYTIHAAADEIVGWVTGQRGMALSRIAYIAKGKTRVVDADGANDHAVTSTGTALSPSWHPNARAIVYSDFSDAGTQIAWLDLESGKTKLLNATPRGLNITPVFTPDGVNVVYASGGEQPAELVIANAGAGIARKIGAGTLTEQSSPSFSPDGKRVAFISPSPKTPQIYTMNVDGTDIKQLTPTVSGVRSYRTGPDWSPDGRAVAYEQQNGDFQVWMITLNDKKMRRLTSIGENEDPSWAPDARHLVLSSTRHGFKNLWVLDTQSGRMRQLTFNDGARLAAWSPTLAAPSSPPAAGGAVPASGNNEH